MTRRGFIVVVTATVILVGVLFVAVLPASTYFSQKSSTATSEAELAKVQAERRRVNKEIARLRTPEEITKRAREDFGYVKPGEEPYAVLPAPTDPIGLPDTWPFIGVERALGAG